MKFDITEIRKRFPILDREVHGRPLVYLDNAATTQMSERVLEVIREQHQLYEANVHRGIHYLSEQSTGRMERARKIIADFLGAAHAEEIIFTSGTTDAVNLAAAGFCETFVQPKDEILVTRMEHHSNFVPWQQAAIRHGAVFKVLPFDENGDLKTDLLMEYLTEKTKIVAVCAVSNVLGTVNPLSDIIKAAHKAGAKVFVDGAQAMRHGKLDMRSLDCDFFAFSGHKVMGPTGTGVLYGKRELLERMRPQSFGGGMVDIVTSERTTFGELPFKFEAGTPNIVGNIALGAAIEEFSAVSEGAFAYEDELIRYTQKMLEQIPEVTILGKPKIRSGAVSFNVNGCHYYDIAVMLDKLGIAVRSGHHCAQPLLEAFSLTGAVRVSPAYYNTKEEIDVLAEGMQRIIALLRRTGKIV